MRYLLLLLIRSLTPRLPLGPPPYGGSGGSLGLIGLGAALITRFVQRRCLFDTRLRAPVAEFTYQTYF